MITFKVCKIEGCGNKAKSKGLCSKHYVRLLRHGDPLGGGTERIPKGTQSGNCKIDGCSNEMVAFGLCSTHYSKLKKYGDPLAGRTNSGGECSVEGCCNPVKGLKLCAKHYDRFKKYGDARSLRPVKMCKVEGCKDVARGRELCQFHYGRWREHGDPLAGGTRRLPSNSQGGKCKVDGCEKPSQSLHLCHNHFTKFKKYGDPLGGSVQDGRSKVWHVRDTGYVMRFELGSPHCGKNGIVYQHRYVMGEHIGRPLRPDENVHHKNGNRADNRLENLELWSKSQPAGQRVADKVKWAREILALYGDLDV